MLHYTNVPDVNNAALCSSYLQSLPAPSKKVPAPGSRFYEFLLPVPAPSKNIMLQFYFFFNEKIHLS